MKINDKRFFELIKDYLTVYLPLQRSVSPHTIKSYRETLNLFIGFLCSFKHLQIREISFTHVTVDSINGFIEWLANTRNCSAVTQNHHLSVIRAFLKYAGMREPVYNDYYLCAGLIARRKEEKKLMVNHFNEEALEAILSQPNPKNRRGHRDQFFMILLYDTGARDSELLHLMPKDVIADTNSPYIIIYGKGKKIRMVPIMRETVQHYKSYMKRFHKEQKPDIPLFYTVIHEEIHRMSDDNAARFIRKYAAMAKAGCSAVPEKVTPHMFRHSRALNMYRKGVPLPLISEWLGHSNLETTLIYAYADTEMKRTAIEKATAANHPLRTTEAFNGADLDDETIKRLYGLM